VLLFTSTRAWANSHFSIPPYLATTKWVRHFRFSRKSTAVLQRRRRLYQRLNDEPSYLHRVDTFLIYGTERILQCQPLYKRFDRCGEQGGTNGKGTAGVSEEHREQLG
jgi:hypothetical protein